MDNESKSHIYLGNLKLATINNTDEPYFALSDHLGSSSVLVDNGGNVAEMTDYLPYGKINYENTVQNLDDDYGFTGHEYDDESNLQYYGARYLDNGLGRFVSVDPATLVLHDGKELKNITQGELIQFLSNPQHLNGYTYSINNPIIYVDPNGEFYGDFGRDIASGQRDIANFLYNAADNTSSQGGFFNKTSGFVTHILGDVANNIANVWDPDQKAGTRVWAFALTAFDASAGGEGKAIIKAGEKVVGLNVTKHAAEQFVKRNMQIGQIADALKGGVKYLDKETGNLLHVVGERGKGGYTIITDQAQKVLVSTENFVRNLSSSKALDRFKLLK